MVQTSISILPSLLCHCGSFLAYQNHDTTSRVTTCFFSSSYFLATSQLLLGLSSRWSPWWNLTAADNTIGQCIVLRFFWYPVLVCSSRVCGESSILPSSVGKSGLFGCVRVNVVGTLLMAYWLCREAVIGHHLVAMMFWCVCCVYAKLRRLC